MQVTGSKRDNSNVSRLSIRIPSGQSLHCESGSVGETITALDLWVEGAVVVPYPSVLAEQLDLEAMMTTSGVSLEQGARVFTSTPEGEISYALRLSAESAAVVEEWQREGKSVQLLSPLMNSVARAIEGCRLRKLVVLTLLNGVAYVAYTNKRQLHYAEALPIGGEQELVNLVALLNQDYDLRRARFVLLGEESKTYYKTLRKYFSRVRVEKNGNY